MTLPQLPALTPFPTNPSAAYYRYNQALQLVLLDFPFIEEALRMCLFQAYRIVSIRTKGILAFSPPLASLEKDPLGRLITKFEDFFDTKPLIAELKQVQPFRNQCAHRGMLLTKKEQTDVDFLRQEAGQLEFKRQSTRRCFTGLIAEAKRLSDIKEP